MTSFLPLLLAANRYRIIDFDFPTLLPGSLKLGAGPLIVIGLIVASFIIGALFAKTVRMRDYGWKIGLILSATLVSTFIVLFGDFKLGVDLKGGVILVYEVNELETQQLRQASRASQSGQDSDWSMSQLIAVITRRLNPTGLKEIVVRPFGPKQVEIVVPEVDQQEIDDIKQKIRTGGVLQFMIVASDDRDNELFQAARDKAELKDDERRITRTVLNDQGEQFGFWARLGRDKNDFRALDIIEKGLLRDSRTGAILDIDPQEKRVFASNAAAFEAYLKQRGISNIDVLMVFDAPFAIYGEDLATEYGANDPLRGHMIHFTMRTDGALKMGHVTAENILRKLAIIFDNEVLSAPVIQSKISDSGEITGRFTQEEIDFLVSILKSGSMKVVMQKEPISENQIGSILGYDTIVKGSWSVVVSLLIVLAFTWAYYRFAGFVACCALILNLLLTLALMILIQAPLTLPGLAGLVLTVGMSVDSNVLIFERMREELSRGAALRMAIRNGFDRAMVTIIDSNLTTLLTAVVLYFIGTDQVKGFGITLILGILTSMFTAIFCARVVFEIGERTRWLKTLRMTHFLTNPNVDWVKLFGPAVIASVIVIGIGLVATVARGKGLFDIDLAGGTSVTFILKEPMPVSEVREKLSQVLDNVEDPATKTRAQFTAYELTLTGDAERAQTVFKVDSSLQDIELLKKSVRQALRTADGKDLLKTYEFEEGKLEESSADAAPPPPVLTAPDARPPAKTESGGKSSAVPEKSPAAEQPAAKAAESKSSAEPATGDSPPTKSAPQTTPKSDDSGCGANEEAAEQDEPAKSTAPDAASKTTTAAQAEPQSPSPQPSAAQPSATQPSATQPSAAQPSAAQPSATQPPAAQPRVKTVTTLRFPGSPISAASLKTRIADAAKSVLKQDLDNIGIDNDKWDRIDNSTFETWTVTLPVDAEQARAVLVALKSDLTNSVVWQTSSQIGGQVSADTRFKAVTAIIVSLIGIVAYMWFRFQKAVWGIAAVVALAHDTLVMLGAIAVSYWLVGVLGFAGVEQFKISLPVIAAFLTLIGYSVNDTIVIFDRIREIRGKSPYITRQMLNDAVNLTMSRTILTSGTVFMVVTVLYFFGGPGIHAFAFSLVVGVISGTYSTVFIAAPLLLWMFDRERKAATGNVAQRETSAGVLAKH